MIIFIFGSPVWKPDFGLQTLAGGLVLYFWCCGYIQHEVMPSKATQTSNEMQQTAAPPRAVLRNKTQRNAAAARQASQPASSNTSKEAFGHSLM